MIVFFIKTFFDFADGEGGRLPVPLFVPQAGRKMRRTVNDEL